MRPQHLDHVAIWAQDRVACADFCLRYLGMHVITESKTFSLVGADARRGKLTFFNAEGPRDRGVLERVVLRSRVAGSPTGTSEERIRLELPAGLRVELSPGTVETDGEIACVTLSLADPDQARRGFERLGFEEREGRLFVGNSELELTAGGPADVSAPLLNHIALLVDSADDLARSAVAEGFEVDRAVDAANTYAVFVRGPEGVLVEYVEHKPSFSLS